MIKVFTDGSCKGPQAKRVAASAVWVPESKQGFVSSVPGRQTNQRSELFAITLALTQVSGDLHIYSDSDYSIKSLTQWCKGWEKNGWKNAKGKPVENQDLIRDLLKLSRGRKIEFTHVYGHQDSDAWEAEANNKVDEIAQSFADGYLTSGVTEVNHETMIDPWDLI